MKRLIIGLILVILLLVPISCAPAESQVEEEGITQAEVEEIFYYENGEQEVIDLNSEDSTGMVSLLARTLHELNSQATCIFSEKEIQEMREKDRCVELVFTSPIDVTISKWTEPEERYHIPVDERGYRILPNIKTALFILESNLGKGLEAHVLVGHESDGNISYGCWAIDIKSWGKTEHDKTWVNSLDRIISESSLRR